MTILERQMEEMRDLPERVTGLASQILQLRQEASSEFSAIRDQLKADTDETRAFMRVLHEDVLMRLKLIGEDNDSDS
ncbi:MAG TPA: hypothetical protein VIR54_28955 [Vicinamibacterales bacterium]